MIIDHVIESLEQAAERADPAPEVYRRLFELHPEMEPLFLRDKDGAVRGHMFQELVAALLDFRGPNVYGGNLFKIERTNHEQLGVPHDIYPKMFRILRDVLRDTLKSNWTEKMETEWQELLGGLHKLLEE